MVEVQKKSTDIRYFGATHTGRLRKHNEDCFVIIDVSASEQEPLGTALLVADGMGGARAGEIASHIARTVVEDRFLMLHRPFSSHQDIEKYLKNLVLEAHQQIMLQAEAHPEYSGMGTTVVLAWLVGTYMHVVWCGDSRCYEYPPHSSATLSPLTDDHSLVWQMVRAGELTPEEARVHEHSNVILQALGSSHTQPVPSYVKKKLTPGKRILLCSDGLNGMLSDAQIQQHLEYEQDLPSMVQGLIDAANAAGGADNITVVLAEVDSVAPLETQEEAAGAAKTRHPWIWLLGLLLIIATLVLVLYPWQSHARPAFPTTIHPSPQGVEYDEPLDATLTLAITASIAAVI